MNIASHIEFSICIITEVAIDTYVHSYKSTRYFGMLNCMLCMLLLLLAAAMLLLQAS